MGGSTVAQCLRLFDEQDRPPFGAHDAPLLLPARTGTLVAWASLRSDGQQDPLAWCALPPHSLFSS
jgi:hypothetical protein